MSEETHPGEVQTSVGTPDYMEKARELADSYPQLLARKQELKRQIDESHAWFYTRDEVIYKLSQGAHEQGERVHTSGTSNPVERTVLNCDKVLASMNREIQKRREEELFAPYGAISIRNTVNTCAAVYVPVNAQDIVDEEFTRLDEDDYIEFQPDLSKITVTLEEMAPHTNARYGRNEIGMGNMFADYFKQIARYNSERKGWYVYDGSVWRPDKGNLKVSELAKLLADKLYVFALTITEEDARKRFIDRVRKLQLRKNRETMLKDAMSVYPISMQAFDRNKYFFNCKNGTLDMRTLEFREHRPEDYLTMESGITY